MGESIDGEVYQRTERRMLNTEEQSSENKIDSCRSSDLRQYQGGSPSSLADIVDEATGKIT